MTHVFEPLRKKMVHEEWFWSCIEVNYRINADPHTPEYAKRLPGDNIDETNMLSFQSVPTLSPQNISLSKGKKKTKEEKEWTRYVVHFCAKRLSIKLMIHKI